MATQKSVLAGLSVVLIVILPCLTNLNYWDPCAVELLLCHLFFIQVRTLRAPLVSAAAHGGCSGQMESGAVVERPVLYTQVWSSVLSYIV